MFSFKTGSIIEEALRLSSASIMIRVANDDFNITLDSGQTAAIRKGDYIAMYPQLIHMDPDVYPNPTVHPSISPVDILEQNTNYTMTHLFYF